MRGMNITILLLAAALVRNGDFSAPLDNSWYGGSFGGGEGRSVILKADDGNPYLRLEKTRGPGGTQAISRDIPLNGATRFRFSMRYRANGGLAFIRYRKEGLNGTEPVKGPTGQAVVITLDTLMRDEKAQRGEWVSFSREYAVPRLVQKEDPLIQLQFQAYPRGDGGVGFFEVDDLVIEPLDPVVEPVSATVSLRAGTRPLETGFGPLEKVFPWKWEIRDGLFLRNGRPFFFCGWGDTTGAGMAGAAGTWLAHLQGIRFIGTYDQTAVHTRKIGANAHETFSLLNPGWISWQRESSRFGMLTEPHPLVMYGKHNPLGQFAADHPEWKEVYFELGHYLGYDTGNPVGRAALAEARRHRFSFTFPFCGTDYCEIAREPGPENCNDRMRAAFRDFVRGKYDGDLALVNRIWRTDFATWDDIRPLHLDPDALAASSQALVLRKHVRATRNEHYLDFLRFMQLDTALRTRNEFEDVRKAVPGMPVTVDIRGHHAYTDGYCAYDPDLIGPLEDICHVHFGYGGSAVTYNDTPVHEPTLCDQTAYPFFAHAYFARNTSHPVVQCEDIISRTILPGSDAEAMARNDFAQLHNRPWRFHLQADDEDGIAAAWFKPGFDDSAWGEVKVPGAWDEQAAYKGKSGIGWYRARFKLDGRLRNDYLDNSRKFLIHGKGVAQSGTVWLNGTKIGDVNGWSTDYSFDVGALLNYGGENEIVWRVNGDGYQNGLRFRCHVLCADMLNSSKPFGERQYAQMYWTYLTRGLSGVLNWNWHDDKLLAFLPSIIVPLETAAGVALKDIRNRRSRVAYLYGFLAQRGLPAAPEKMHYVTMRWNNALEFSGVRPDLVSEATFVRDVTPDRYPLLVVPETEIVDDATYAHFKDYLAKGGTAVITTNALRRTFSRFQPTDVDALDGRIVRLPADLSMAELMVALKPHLPAPEIPVTALSPRETPLVDRLLAGGDDARVLYLANWGGYDQELAVTLPDDLAGWKLTDLRGRFTRGADGRLRVSLASQDVAACLVTRGEPAAWMRTAPSAANAAVWKRLLALNANRDTGRPKVLWATDMHLYPYLLDRFDAFGFESIEPCLPEKWTPETLAGAKVIVIAEGATALLNKVFARKDFAPMLRTWVENGGSLLVAGFSAGTVNAYGSCLRQIANAFGVNGEWCSVAKDTAHAGLGDAWQILSPDVAADSPLTTGVSKVQLFALSPLNAIRDAPVQPVVRIPATAEAHPGKMAMAAVEVGKGRVFVSADTMFWQPLRIELADNAALTENLVGWLVRQPVTDAMREDFRKNLFVRFDAD